MKVKNIKAKVAAKVAKGKANRAANPTAGNLAKFDANGNPTDSEIPAASVPLMSAYTLVAATVINSASQETVDGQTVRYAEVTLADRTMNCIAVNVALDDLRVTLPDPVVNKASDFGVRVEVGDGTAALTAPAMKFVQDPTYAFYLENPEGSMPAFADGTATEKGVTQLHFRETERLLDAARYFLVKGGQVQEAKVVPALCLAPNTPILMADGSTCRIADVCAGDMVATPKGADEVVLASFGHGDSRDVWRFDDGTEIVTVGRHRFWNHELGEPMYLEAWHIGEHAVRSDGKLTALVSHEHIEEPSDHATLFTKRWNAYYAGGLLAGNRNTDKEVMA